METDRDELLPRPFVPLSTFFFLVVIVVVLKTYYSSVKLEMGTHQPVGEREERRRHSRIGPEMIPQPLSKRTSTAK